MSVLVPQLHFLIKIWLWGIMQRNGFIHCVVGWRGWDGAHGLGAASSSVEAHRDVLPPSPPPFFRGPSAVDIPDAGQAEGKAEGPALLLEFAWAPARHCTETLTPLEQLPGRVKPVHQPELLK